MPLRETCQSSYSHRIKEPGSEATAIDSKLYRTSPHLPLPPFPTGFHPRSGTCLTVVVRRRYSHTENVKLVLSSRHASLRHASGSRKPSSKQPAAILCQTMASLCLEVARRREPYYIKPIVQIDTAMAMAITMVAEMTRAVAIEVEADIGSICSRCCGWIHPSSDAV